MVGLSGKLLARPAPVGIVREPLRKLGRQLPPLSLIYSEETERMDPLKISNDTRDALHWVKARKIDTGGLGHYLGERETARLVEAGYLDGGDPYRWSLTKLGRAALAASN